MGTKLTPRQNEIISGALAKMAVDQFMSDRLTERLSEARIALVHAMIEITSQTEIDPTSSNDPSICG